MPLPFAFLVGLVFGGSLAWIARVELARSEVPLLLARPFQVALAMGFLVFAPVVGYFAMLHGDWAYLYLVRSARVPSAIDLALVVAAGAQVPLGFVLAAPWSIAKRGTALAKIAGALALVLLVASAIAARRLATDASYAQYHGAFGTVPLGKSALGRGILWSWIALAAAYAWSVRVLRSSRPPA
jgi:hypothetical protein